MGRVSGLKRPTVIRVWHFFRAKYVGEYLIGHRLVPHDAAQLESETAREGADHGALCGKLSSDGLKYGGFPSKPHTIESNRKRGRLVLLIRRMTSDQPHRDGITINLHSKPRLPCIYELGSGIHAL